jgi:hypothetical protein
MKHPRDEIRQVTEGEGVNSDTPNFIELLTSQIIKSYEPRSNAELHNFLLQAYVQLPSYFLSLRWQRKGSNMSSGPFFCPIIRAKIFRKWKKR